MCDERGSQAQAGVVRWPLANAMNTSQTPKWLRVLERRLNWLAIPNIAVLLVTLQGLGFLMVFSDPVWIERLALLPGRVASGEYWRLITFLALPVSMSPLWVIFSLWFLYFIVNAIESIWGSFKTTLYILTSVIITIIVSFLLGFAVTQASDFQSTLFLAAAALFPEMEIRVFMAIPVKMKWLGWIAVGFLIFRFLGADLGGRIYLLAIYSNCMIFFGPALLSRVRQAIRRWNYRRKL